MYLALKERNRSGSFAKFTFFHVKEEIHARISVHERSAIIKILSYQKYVAVSLCSSSKTDSDNLFVSQMSFIFSPYLIS